MVSLDGAELERRTLAKPTTYNLDFGFALLCKPVVRFGILAIMKKLILGILVAIFALGVVIVDAALATVFVYMGWNWGVVPTFSGTHEIPWSTAFWLGLFLSTLGWFFKPALKNES